MKTPHIESNEMDVAPLVIMPGDPLRAKYIADTYLKDVKQINSVRNMFGYTGYYNDKRVTIFASGMGIPSIGIYAYELYKFYNVETIIRIGTCGTSKEEVKLLDVLLADNSYSLSTFAEVFGDCKEHFMPATKELNDIIENVATSRNKKVIRGNIITSDIFDVYVDHEKNLARYPKDIEFIGLEMEAFGLFYLAKLLNKKAACLLTVVDSKYDKSELTSEERQTSLNDMIELALETL